MQYIYHEPSEYGFQNQDGHSAKFFPTESPYTKHLIIECDEKLTVSLVQHESEFDYYVLEGTGYFMINDEKQMVAKGDLIVLPPGTKYTFVGRLKMLLINAPKWTPEQEEVIRL